MSKLNKRDKVKLVANTPELTDAIKLLVTLMKTENIKDFIQYKYQVGDEQYKFRIEKVKPANKRKSKS